MPPCCQAMWSQPPAPPARGGATAAGSHAPGSEQHLELSAAAGGSPRGRGQGRAGHTSCRMGWERGAPGSPAASGAWVLAGSLGEGPWGWPRPGFLPPLPGPCWLVLGGPGAGVCCFLLPSPQSQLLGPSRPPPTHARARPCSPSCARLPCGWLGGMDGGAAGAERQGGGAPLGAAHLASSWWKPGLPPPSLPLPSPAGHISGPSLGCLAPGCQTLASPGSAPAWRLAPSRAEPLRHPAALQLCPRGPRAPPASTCSTADHPGSSGQGCCRQCSASPRPR